MLVLLLAGIALFIFVRYLCATAPPFAKASYLIPRLALGGGLSGAAMLLCLHRPTCDAFNLLTKAFRRRSPAAARQLAVCVALIATVYLASAAWLNRRELAPRIHDEKSYTVQARMLAHGMLWRAPHPLAKSFETFYVFNEPVYGSKYFPGAMMLYVPGVWLGAPDWVTSLIIGGLIAGLTCLVTTELLNGDGLAGVTASVLLLGADSVHDLATWTLSHQPAVLGALLTIYAYLRWRATGWRRWAIAAGFVAGWTAITRPVDAVAYALPLGIVILIDIWRRTPHTNWRRGLSDVALMILAAVPMLGVQAVFDKGVTGHWLETPYRMYLDSYQPGAAFGAMGAAQHPQTELRQKIDFYDDYIAPRLQGYRAAGAWWTLWNVRVPVLATHALANPLILLLLPAGAAACLVDRRLAIFVLAPLLFPLCYLPNFFFEWYYSIIIAPAIAIIGIVGAMSLARWLPDRLHRKASAAIRLGLLGLALGGIPELLGDFHTDVPTMRAPLVEQTVAESVQAPALVFFTYHPEVQRSFHIEPVYAMETGWPDTESIVRAQDLGDEKNGALISYYAHLQPSRRVYIIDRKTLAAKYLGTADQLAAAHARGSVNPSTPKSLP